MLPLNALVVGPPRGRAALVQALRRAQLAEFHFAEADSGAAGLAGFDPAAVQIGFVDAGLPDMTGAEFVRRVRDLGTTRHVPMVLVGADPSPAAGANARLPAPFTADDVRAVLQPIIIELERYNAPKHGSWFVKLFA